MAPTRRAPALSAADICHLRIGADAARRSARGAGGHPAPHAPQCCWKAVRRAEQSRSARAAGQGSVSQPCQLLAPMTVQFPCWERVKGTQIPAAHHRWAGDKADREVSEKSTRFKENMS